MRQHGRDRGRAVRRIHGLPLGGVGIASVLWTLGLGGCDIMRLVKDTSEGIKGTNQQLAAANQTMRDSVTVLSKTGETLRTVQPSLDRVADLDPAMRKLGDMKASMDRLADMKTQFEQMQHAMEKMTAMQGTLERMGALAPRLQAVADLRQPMTQVAGLQPTLQAVADLNKPMTELNRLGGSMERVAQLHGPLTKTGELVGPITTVAEQLGGAQSAQRSYTLYVFGAAMLWMLATALGVLLGVVIGNRLTRRARST